MGSRTDLIWPNLVVSPPGEAASAQPSRKGKVHGLVLIGLVLIGHAMPHDEYQTREDKAAGRSSAHHSKSRSSPMFNRFQRRRNPESPAMASSRSYRGMAEQRRRDTLSGKGRWRVMRIRERWAALIARLQAEKLARDRLRTMRRGRVRLAWQTCRRCRRVWLSPASGDQLCSSCRQRSSTQQDRPEKKV
jgi:hypothetical protein